MTTRSADKLSMLVDNELDEWDEPELIESLKDDGELKSRWSSYHLIGDAMRSTLPRHVDVGLADRVAASLEHEPAFMKPGTASRGSRQDSGSIPGRRQSPRTNTSTSIGFALAASMSAIAVFGMMQIDQQAGVEGPATVASAGQVSLASSEPAAGFDGGGSVVLASATYRQDAQPQAMEAKADSKPVADDLYDYLVNYQQYAANTGAGEDMLSYIRTASYQQPF